jgi:ABC-2 type transport system permease protein
MIEKTRVKYRYSLILLKELVSSDFKLRYQGSILGYLWSLLRPLALFAVLYFVFVKFLKIGEGVPHYAIYLLVGIVLWNFFVEITTGSVSAVVAKGDLIRKINFPKYIIVFSNSISALINLGFNSIVIAIFLLVFGAEPSAWAVLIIPLLLVELYIFGLAFAFLLSAAYVKYRDVGFIWEVLLQIGFYATPILYPLTLVPLKFQKLIMLNPLAQIIQDARYVLVTKQTVTMNMVFNSPYARLVPVLIAVLLFIVGAMYFRKNSRYFAERV